MTAVESGGDPHVWKARPALAWSIRAGLVVVPLFASWIGAHVAASFVSRPGGIGPNAVWFVGIVVVSVIVHQLARRLLRRFSSLSVLFSLSLTFPAAAPSRMKTFLRHARGGSAGAANDGLEGLVDLVATLSRKDGRLSRHGDRVGGYAALIAKELRLSDAEIERLRWASLVHDIGQLDLPPRLLVGRGEYSEADHEKVQEHAAGAASYLRPHLEWLGDSALVAEQHHERWDGTGYPAGLSGEQISLEARIVAVADAYDAMTGARFYKKPVTPDAARRELVDGAGTQFDPAVVRAFVAAGIEKGGVELGSLGGLVEVVSQFASVASGAGASAAATASVSVATAAAVATTAIVVPEIATNVEANRPQVERIVEIEDEPEARPEEPTLQSVTTLAPSSTTTTSTSTTTTTTTTSTTTTTTAPPVTLPPTTTTTPPALPPPTTTTTLAVVTTTTLPAYPTVPVTTTTVPTYPTIGG